MDTNKEREARGWRRLRKWELQTAIKQRTLMALCPQTTERYIKYMSVCLRNVFAEDKRDIYKQLSSPYETNFQYSQVPVIINELRYRQEAWHLVP